MSQPTRSEPVTVIVGAGIAGLAAAYELAVCGVPFLVLEASARAGGVILTEQVDGFTIDAGPDALLVQKPAAIQLCQEIGLGGRLIPTTPPRTAYIVRRGTLHPLPERSMLGIPTGVLPLAASRLFSLRGKLRMTLDLVRPAGQLRAGQDESIASFVGRRFGREAVTYLAEPLLAGIHAGDVDRLSMRALFPRLLDAEQRHGSLIRACGRAPRARGSEGVFRSLPGGMGELVETLVGRLPAGALRLRQRVTGLEPGRPLRLRLEGGERVHAARVIVAVPAYVAATLLRPLDARLADLCAGIRYESAVTIALAYPRQAIRHPLAGSGFVVPRVEPGTRVMAASWVSSKWPGRAPPNHVLLRAFLGGARDPDAVGRPDEVLVAEARATLDTLLGIDRPPLLSRVYRWEQATAQHDVGHLERVARIEERLQGLPGLWLTGSAYRGTGIPDCVADGRTTARQAIGKLPA